MMLLANQPSYSCSQLAHLVVHFTEVVQLGDLPALGAVLFTKEEVVKEILNSSQVSFGSQPVSWLTLDVMIMKISVVLSFVSNADTALTNIGALQMLPELTEEQNSVITTLKSAFTSEQLTGSSV